MAAKGFRGDETNCNYRDVRDRDARDALSRAVRLCDGPPEEFDAGRADPHLSQSGRAGLFVR